MNWRQVLPIIAILSACGDPDGGSTSVDADADGYPQATDCDDGNGDVHPYAEEVCNGIDDDCDGVIDPDKLSFYTDADGDGYGTGTVQEGCDATGFASVDGDCDDTDANVSPDGTEICDGVDNDCDGVTDPDKLSLYVDSDGDGYGAGDLVERCDSVGHTDVAGDCDDANPNVNPDGAEVCDTVDNDCDGAVDEADNDITGLKTFYIDGDGDGYGSTRGTQQACFVPTGYVENADDCDDTNAELNPLTSWYVDSDGDGHGTNSSPLASCAPPAGYARSTDDCDDADPDTYPGAPQACEDFDRNCDNLPEDDRDGDGYLRAACGGVDCDDANASVTPTPGGGCTLYNDCAELQQHYPNTPDGTYWFSVLHASPQEVELTCDMSTDGGGWTLATTARAGNADRCTTSPNYTPPFALARQVAQKWLYEDNKKGGQMLSKVIIGTGFGNVRDNSTFRVDIVGTNVNTSFYMPAMWDLLDFSYTGIGWGEPVGAFSINKLSGGSSTGTGVYWDGTGATGKRVLYCIGGQTPEQSTTGTRPQICLPSGDYVGHCDDLGWGSKWLTGGTLDAGRHLLYIRPPQ